MINVEGQLNYMNTTPQTTYQSSISGPNHLTSPTMTPQIFHQVFNPTPMNLNYNTQNTTQPPQP